MTEERTNKSSCIYKISSITKPDIFYIGSAVNFQARKLKHLSSLRRGVHINNYLQNHYLKYGIDDLYFEIVENVINKESLLDREQFYIDTLKPKFNLCKIAGSCLGRNPSKETKEKIRNSLLGIKHTDERKKNIQISLNKLYKPINVLIGDEIILVESVKKATLLTGVPKSGIRRCCLNNNYTYNGYKFKYVNNDK